MKSMHHHLYFAILSYACIFSIKTLEEQDLLIDISNTIRVINHYP